MESKFPKNKKSASEGNAPNVDLTRSFADSLSENDILTEGMPIHPIESTSHDSILDRLLLQVKPIDFRAKVNFSKEEERLKRKHFLIVVIEEILDLARINNWGLCTYEGFVYAYNGNFWNKITKEELQAFLGQAAEKMGVDQFDAKYFEFREPLLKQFFALSRLKQPSKVHDQVLINLNNGTLEITSGFPKLRPATQADFLTHQLPFDFDKKATCPRFITFLDEVLPEKESQMVIQEYLGYVFVRSSMLKMEKVLLLYGTGANGKSVLFEIVNALLGGQNNVCSYSLQELTDNNGQYRAEIGNKLLNYASEINNRMEADIFKRLASGEPVVARPLYGHPITLTNYAKLMFNCNELPKNVEQTPAFFRRFIIVPFTVQIPEEKQDKELAKTIIKSELAGILNWVLEGLERLLKQKKFTHSPLIANQLEAFKKESDSLPMFLEDEGYQKSSISDLPLRQVYVEYRRYCLESGFFPGSLQTFGTRLRNLGFMQHRKADGNFVFIEKRNVHSEAT